MAISMYVMRCAIWYHLYNLKNVKTPIGGVVLLLKLQPTNLLKETLRHECFSRFLKCANSTKSRKTSHIWLSKNYF